MRNDFGVCMKAGGLVGGQKKLDLNKDGKITGADFKMLRKKKTKKKDKVEESRKNDDDSSYFETWKVPYVEP